MTNPLVTGLQSRCPECGKGRLFGEFLEVKPCDVCGLDLSKSNLGDGFSTVIFLLIGALGCLGIVWTQLAFNMPIWLEILIWLPVVGVLCVVTQQPFKALMVALLYRNQAAEAVTRSKPSEDHAAAGHDQGVGA